MLCVFEKIGGADEIMIHPGHCIADPKGPGFTHHTLYGSPTPLDPEKFSVREPRTDAEWYEARLNLLPRGVRSAAERDAHLSSLLRSWALTGKVPAEWPPKTPPGLACAPPAKMVNADVTKALAYAVIGMVESKQAVVAAFSSALQKQAPK